jgi:Fe-S cluster assembly ATP-binding protein
MAILLITHYQRMLNYIQPDAVHVMVGGRIVRSGGPEVAIALEEQGYADWKDQEGEEEGKKAEEQEEVVTA